jgi:uncharacterized protein (TIGR00295 family)
MAVAKISLDIAKQLEKKGVKLDLKLVEAGALLHDIGRSKSNTVDHGVIGAQIVRSEGLPTAIAGIIKTHVGGGFTAKEAAEFGWPKDVYSPITLEEKIVSYADKLVDNSKHGRVPIDIEIKRLQAAGHKEAAERVRKLDDEITALLGN